MLASLAAAALIGVVAWPPQSAPIFEGRDYLHMAEGHYHSAYYYYAGRILHPLAVHGLVTMARVSYAHAFQLMAVLSLSVLIVGSEWFLLRFDRKAGWYLLPLVATPVLIMNFQFDYFPDLFHAALCVIFFLVFELNAWVALPILTLLHITRETSILLTIVVVILSAAAGRRSLAVCAAFFGATGLAISSALVNMGLPNKHGLSTPIFDAFKLLYNFIHLFGLVFSTDTNANVVGGTPIWSIHVDLGSIHEIGFYGFDFQHPLQIVVCLVLAFGIMPVYLMRVRVRRESLSLKVAYWYGLLCLVAAPLIGVWTSRYVLYAWPLFWLVRPVALADESNSTAIAILAMSMISCWIPVAGPALLGHSWIGQAAFGSLFAGWSNQLASLSLEVIIYLGAFRMIKGLRRETEQAEDLGADLRTAP
jgi:hypothetical protein